MIRLKCRGIFLPRRIRLALVFSVDENRVQTERQRYNEGTIGRTTAAGTGPMIHLSCKTTISIYPSRPRGRANTSEYQQYALYVPLNASYYNGTQHKERLKREGIVHQQSAHASIKTCILCSYFWPFLQPNQQHQPWPKRWLWDTAET